MSIRERAGCLSFNDISEAQLRILLRYLRDPAGAKRRGSGRPDGGFVRRIRGPRAQPTGGSKYKSNKGWFADPDGYPAIVPPWGTLSAIDMNTGRYLWQVPLGYYPELAAKGLSNTGTLNYGGPLVTAGGIVFIAATAFDCKIRAFDSQTGKLLWIGDLPLPGTATPATYSIAGSSTC